VQQGIRSSVNERYPKCQPAFGVADKHKLAVHIIFEEKILLCSLLTVYEIYNILEFRISLSVDI
jgi:hypothetical protein